MSFIAICGGGGKSTICKKYPELFLDIDDFIWSDINKKYHKELIESINNNCIDKIGIIYKNIMINNGDKISSNKIILGHNPINAKWLKINFLVSIKPNKEIHEKNIESRSDILKNIARKCWNNLEDALIYKNYEEFESILLNYV